ncbi:GNAT family N-acetyltransferase [Saliphagus sp. LR7]|uniref:GNAT family N-acetyltransferase n=1 Tax=Saliphagus sp. LR7 TaxID=2282654 RepID=UPI000DF7F978|nr:GNAT family N-acetyltransferase [Saliphagus sp. LR7]
MEIRQASSDDAVAIVDELWMPFAKEMAKLDEYNVLASDIRADAIKHREEKLSQANYCAQLAIEDDAFVGFTTGEVQPSAPVFERGATLAISEAYVRPEWRQQGIASSLLEALEMWADERGYETASLSVNADNHAAKALYECLGFEAKCLQMVKTSD